MHSSTSELARSGIDALRGLGYSFHLADRLVHALTWAEAVEGGALRLLRLEEDRIRAKISAKLHLSDANSGDRFAVLEAGGKCALEGGAHGLDLVHGEARRRGAASILVRNSFGDCMISALANQSAQRGLPLFILLTARESRRAILGLPMTQRTYVASRILPLEHAQWGEWCEELVASLAGAQAAACCLPALEMMDQHAGADFDFLMISAGAKENQSETMKRFEAECSVLGEVQDLHSRWLAALFRGLEIADDDWRHLGRLIARTRVPTSERSQMQAG